MLVEFSCEHCDMLLSADVEAGAEVTCPHCQNVTIVPEGLASLPRPQVPGQEQADAAGQSPPPPAQQTEGEEEETLEEEHAPGGAMRTLALGMPWLVSGFFHIAVLLILSLIVMYEILDKSKEVAAAEAVTLPEQVEFLTDTVEAMSETPSLRPTEDRDFAPRERPSINESQASDVVSPIAMEAVGATGGPGFAGPGGDGRGTGGGMYGSPSVGARSVVYVIDRSGSMHRTFGLVRAEMLRSISNLTEQQDFHVILFATGDPLEKQPDRMTPATDEYRQRAALFLASVEAEGSTDPIPALRKAFLVLSAARAERPGKLIHLLTDGDFPNNAATLEEIRRLNRNGQVHINTFLYGQRPEEAERVLQQIADENQGTYKYVSPDEAY